MLTIPFTQFLLPDGRKREMTIEVVPEVAEMASNLIADGYKFEIEILTNGMVSASVEKPESHEDDPQTLAMKIMPNGPGMQEAIEEMTAEGYGIVFGDKK